MDLICIEDIKVPLTCAEEFKTNVCRTAEEFKHLRTKLLRSLQSKNSTNVKTDFQESRSTASSDDNGSIDNRFQQVSDADIDEHVRNDRPAVVVFGVNSSGKTSFVQRFLGVGSILPADFGPVTARIVQFTYAPGARACFRVYKTIEKTFVENEGDLSHFFTDQLEPDWDGITNVLLPHVNRPEDLDENSTEFHEWGRCFVELSIPSDVLHLGIDIFDTPGFLSDNREQVLIENLHELVKRNKPILVFLYDNATISDTDRNCFLAMKNALGSLERVPTFFLNTKADCISIANDYSLDDDPEYVPLDVFQDTLGQKRQHCYELLLRRREMANEVLGCSPDSVDQCTFFDICTIPKGFDPWEKYTTLINSSTFQRIVEYAAESYSTRTLTLAQDILETVDDYFDLVVSTTRRSPHQWESLRTEALEWGEKFFDEYEKILPNLTDTLSENILKLFDELKPQIARQAALRVRTDDPIDSLLQNNAKSVRDYIGLAIQEQIVKVAANNVIISKRNEIQTLIANHFERQHGLRKNELLAISKRQVLGDISGKRLNQTDSVNTVMDKLLKIPTACARFCRSLPTRLSAYKKEVYNRFVQARIVNNDDSVYKLLDAMDAYATLSNEDGRRRFADMCLTENETKIREQKERFADNLVAWVQEQRKAFETNVQENYVYVTARLSSQQTIHNVIMQLSGSFTKIEGELLAAIELHKRKGVVPVLGVELGRGGFYSVHAAQWGSDSNLAVKKLLNVSDENAYVATLEAHYHRVATLSRVDHIIPLLYLYQNKISDNQRELWLVMPKYTMSLRDYLRQHIQELSFTRAVSFALIIAKALADLHRLEIVHRDVKTSNIMLDDNEQCYIIDFGTAKFGFFNKTILGTFPLPPEIIEAHLKSRTGFVHYDGTAADVYSFGLVLYEMLPKPSYERLNTETLSDLKGLFRLNPQSDANTKHYEKLIAVCLSSDPALRPSAAKLVSDLQTIQQTTEGKLCIVCDDRERKIRCLPCGHKVTCNECWESWSEESDGNTRCILCKAIVTDQIQDNSNDTFIL